MTVSLTQQAEAILARAKAMDAYRAVEFRHKHVRDSYCDEAKALLSLCEDLAADADELTVDDWTPWPDDDYAYEMAVSDRLLEAAE